MFQALCNQNNQIMWAVFHFIFQSTTKNHDQFYAWHRWDKNPLKNRETVKVPLMGRALEGIRRGNMMVTHLLMGFGKDHNPKNWWIFTPEEVWQKLYQLWDIVPPSQIFLTRMYYSMSSAHACIFVLLMWSFHSMFRFCPWSSSM
jgi:hypothetical protein